MKSQSFLGDTPTVESVVARCPHPDELRELLSERLRETRVLRQALRIAERLHRERLATKGGHNGR